MESLINDLKNINNDIFAQFGIEKDYFISVKDDYNWELIQEENINIVKYYKGNEIKTSLIVNKGTEPLIIEKNGYTMIIAIDCIKIAFIFNNSLKR